VRFSKCLNYRINCSSQIPYCPDREKSTSHSSPIKHFPHILIRKYLPVSDLDFSNATFVVDLFHFNWKTYNSEQNESENWTLLVSYLIRERNTFLLLLPWVYEKNWNGWSRDGIPVGARFSTSIQTAPGYCVFSESKSAGVWRWPTTQSSAEVKERVGLYVYFLSGLRGLFWSKLYLYLCCFGDKS
jgi:hypothetical protein